MKIYRTNSYDTILGINNLGGNYYHEQDLSQEKHA